MSRRIADLLIKIGADSYEFQQKAKESVWVTAADLYGQDLIDLADSFNK